MSVAKSPTVSEYRAPQIVIVWTDRPRLSVPNGKWRFGASNGRPVHVQVGTIALRLAMNGAKRATTTKKTRM